MLHQLYACRLIATNMHVRPRSWEQVAAAQGRTRSEMQAGLMLDVLQPDEMPRWKVPQYWKALVPVDALQSRFVEVGDEEDPDLIAAELQSEPDIVDTPESGVIDVPLFWRTQWPGRGCGNGTRCLSVCRIRYDCVLACMWR